MTRRERHRLVSLAQQRLHGDTESTAAIRGDTGFATMFFTLMLVPLLIVTAFAVDAGAWYAQATRTQRAADAAALAGAVWSPTTDAAILASNRAISRNWFASGTAPTCNGADGRVTCGWDTNTNRWKVTVKNTAPRYLSNVGGLLPFNISRPVTAEYLPTLNLGSRTMAFGNQMNCTGALLGIDCLVQDILDLFYPEWWGSVNGPYASYSDGDPFSTRCGATGNGTSCSGSPSANADFNADGYTYLLEVLPGASDPQPLTLQVYDPGCNYDGLISANVTKDVNCTSADSVTQFKMYPATNKVDLRANDADPLPSCGTGTNPLNANPGNSSVFSQYIEKWVTVCSFNAHPGEIYPIKVRTTNSACTTTGCRGKGQNNFSLRACHQLNAGQWCDLSNLNVNHQVAAIYGQKFMSVMLNPGELGIFGQNFQLNTVYIPTAYAGKKLHVRMFDPGDSTFTNFLNLFSSSYTRYQITNNVGSTLDCDYNSTTNYQAVMPTSGLSNDADCKFDVTYSPWLFGLFGNTTVYYQGKWLNTDVDIPTDYTCSGNSCWWNITVRFPAAISTSINDRVTIAAFVDNEPVHLIK